MLGYLMAFVLFIFGAAVTWFIAVMQYLTGTESQAPLYQRADPGLTG